MSGLRSTPTTTGASRTKEREAITADGRLVLRLERTFRASRGVVYRALTDPRELAKWWGPHGFTAPSVEVDPRVGGGYRIAMQPPDGDVFHVSGEFRHVEPPTRLAYTFRWEPPHPDDRETVVTLTLEHLGEATQVRLTQRDFATEERYVLHRGGWSESFDRLEQVLADAPQQGAASAAV